MGGRSLSLPCPQLALQSSSPVVKNYPWALTHPSVLPCLPVAVVLLLAVVLLKLVVPNSRVLCLLFLSFHQ